jgi:hypothetical protein
MTHNSTNLSVQDAVILPKYGKLVIATKTGLLSLNIDNPENKPKCTSNALFKHLKVSPCGYFLVAFD